MTQQAELQVLRPEITVSRATRQSKAPAITRAGAVLRLLGESPSPLGVQAIARKLGLVPSTCLYVLRALVAEGLLSFDPKTKVYALEVGILALARQWMQHDRLCDLAAPVLEGLADSFDVRALVMQSVGIEQNVVIAASRSGESPSFSARVGMVFPALLGAVGQCIAAFGQHADEALRLRFEQLRWYSAPSYEEWKVRVQRTREQGFATDEGRYISGLTFVAVPVWKEPDRSNHVLVVVGDTSTSRPELTAMQEALIFSARLLTNQLRQPLAR